MKNIKLSLSMLLLGLIVLTACEKTKNITIYNVPVYEQLYLVGDATPAGWDIAKPTPMIVDPNDPFTFTWTGPLTVGNFKIPTTTGNWGCDFFMPVINDESDLTKTTIELVKGGNPDKKWKITLAGTYKITINILDPGPYTIKFVKQ
ncbi:MAG TPA: SusF/SusE family outer membrane protein [Prolixibacteraceae bacterium]|jgi:hypothetical protein